MLCLFFSDPEIIVTLWITGSPKARKSPHSGTQTTIQGFQHPVFSGLGENTYLMDLVHFSVR